MPTLPDLATVPLPDVVVLAMRLANAMYLDVYGLKPYPPVAK